MGVSICPNWKWRYVYLHFGANVGLVITIIEYLYWNSYHNSQSSNSTRLHLVLLLLWLLWNSVQFSDNDVLLDSIDMPLNISFFEYAIEYGG